MMRPTWLQTYCVVAFGAILALVPAPSTGSDFRLALAQPPVSEELAIPDSPDGAGWSDNFDAYTTGSELIGQGGWEGWGGSATAGALTSSTQAFSPLNSADIVGDTDLVHQYASITSGIWVYSARQYIPSTVTGSSYFILLNTYPASVFGHWSMQMCFDSAADVVRDDSDGTCTGTTTLPLVYDQWVPITAVINLTTDTQTVFYNGTQLFTGPWSTHLGPEGVLAIRAVDLFANNASSVFWDDLSLINVIFAGDFETGDTSAWSLTVP
jgi:hypothetical protein